MTAGRRLAGVVARAVALAAACALLAGPSALAREIVLPPPTDGMEGEHAAGGKAPTPGTRDFASTHVNRCRGRDGVVVLQDAPCPTAAAPDAASVPAVEVVELSALAPRPVASAAVAKEAAPSRRLLAGMLDGAWKLGLLVLAGYLLYRGLGSVRATLRQRRVTTSMPTATRGRRSRSR